MAKNPKHHGRMKHLDMRFFWLWDAVVQKQLTLEFVSTEDQAADSLTKALLAPKFCKC